MPKIAFSSNLLSQVATKAGEERREFVQPLALGQVPAIGIKSSEMTAIMYGTLEFYSAAERLHQIRSMLVQPSPTVSRSKEVRLRASFRGNSEEELRAIQYSYQAGRRWSHDDVSVRGQPAVLDLAERAAEKLLEVVTRKLP